MKNFKSILLTLIQFLSIGYLLLALPVFTKNVFTLGIQLFGVFLGIWAIIVMSKSKLNITPVPLEGSSLINSGPYRIVRHPMYTSLLLFLTPIVFYYSTKMGFLVYGIFLVNLILKLTYEEQLLQQTFNRYEDYRQDTWRLIPWIY